MLPLPSSEGWSGAARCMHNGLDVVGLELSDREAFRDCYTVLRPLYDPYFANLARAKGGDPSDRHDGHLAHQEEAAG